MKRLVRRALRYDHGTGRLRVQILKLRSPLSLAIFLAVLMPLALACHRFFERPVQQWIRRRFAGRTRDEAPPLTVAAVQAPAPTGG